MNDEYNYSDLTKTYILITDYFKIIHSIVTLYI